MLQPKRTKYRKQFKGRNGGLAQRGSNVSFGEFGLKANDGRISLGAAGNDERSFLKAKAARCKQHANIVYTEQTDIEHTGARSDAEGPEWLTERSCRPAEPAWAWAWASAKKMDSRRASEPRCRRFRQSN
jgi:hypothetical protein